VGFHRRLGEELALGDLGIGEAAGGEGEDLPLPVGELGEGRWRRTQGAENWANSSRVAAAAMTAEPDCTVRIAASRNSGSASFRRKPLALTNRAGGRLVEVERREHDDPRRRGCQARIGQQLGGRCEAVHHRHPDVHEHDVGARLADDAHAFGPVSASPTTVRSGCESMTMRMPARKRAWSSMRTTRIGAHRATPGTCEPGRFGPGAIPEDRLPGDRQRGGHDEDLPAGRRLEVPADELCALAHADEPVSARLALPRSPCAAASGDGGSMGLLTLSSTLPGCHAARSPRRAPWRNALVSASCRMRKTASCTAEGTSALGMGSTSTRSATPAARTCASSRSASGLRAFGLRVPQLRQQHPHVGQRGAGRGEMVPSVAAATAGSDAAA
jgi:hypothetical protein